MNVPTRITTSSNGAMLPGTLTSEQRVAVLIGPAMSGRSPVMIFSQRAAASRKVCLYLSATVESNRTVMLYPLAPGFGGGGVTGGGAGGGGAGGVTGGGLGGVTTGGGFAGGGFVGGGLAGGGLVGGIGLGCGVGAGGIGLGAGCRLEPITTLLLSLTVPPLPSLTLNFAVNVPLPGYV